MIGLMFVGAIGLWTLIALFLGIKLPQWLKLNWAWSFLFVPLAFFTPVIDEVIAIPQAYALCKQAEDAFWYDLSTRKSVLNYYDTHSSEGITLGLNIKAQVRHSTSFTKVDPRPAIKSMEVFFSAGFLKAPAGSSGTFMPLLLPEQCPTPLWSIDKYQEAIKLLELSREPRPKT